MVFSSLTFVFMFLPMVIGIYYILPNRQLKNVWLLVSSLFFYAWGEPIYVGIMLLSTVNDYSFSRLIDLAKKAGKLYKAKIYLICSILFNMGLLGFFKYGNFLVDNLNSIFGTGWHLHDLPLPIGISFYTFQTMSYTIDVYRGHVKAQKKILPIATYVTLFPQLIAGPIVRYITVEDELTNRRENITDFSEGLRRFIIGLGKKVLIANQMGLIADRVFNDFGSETGTIMAWIGILAYTFQIYFDFSGYSDMAIGLGRIFGFHFLENFNYPYMSKSITEFWRRWHISLGTWFKEYIYIPLGGNKKHKIINILIVWFLTGFWHGANWNYIIWGLYFGLLLLLEKYVYGRFLAKTPSFVQHLYAMFLVVIGWVFFRIEDIDLIKSCLKTLFVYQPTTMNSLMFDYQSILYALPFFALAGIGSTPVVKKIIGDGAHMDRRKGLAVVKDGYLIIVMILALVFLVGETYNPFIYFRF